MTTTINQLNPEHYRPNVPDLATHWINTREVQAVVITAADYDGKGNWDGLPFKPLGQADVNYPQWLLDAVQQGIIRVVEDREADYAVWGLYDDTEFVILGNPGDYIVWFKSTKTIHFINESLAKELF